MESAEAKPITVLFRHAVHPVIVHGASTRISADYPGFAVQTLHGSIGKQVVDLSAQGCRGNINAFPRRGSIDAAAAAGRGLGQAVARAVQAKPDVLSAGSLSIVSDDRPRVVSGGSPRRQGGTAIRPAHA